MPSFNPPAGLSAARTAALAALWRSRALTGLLALLLVCPACWAMASPWPTTDWAVSTPEAQGVDSKALIGLYERIAQPGLEPDSVLIVRNGHVISEAAFAPYEPGFVHDLRSVTKSVLGTLVGIALEQGRIPALGQPVMPYFAEHGVPDPRQRAMTVEHLLDMRAGIRWREWPYDVQSDVLRMAASPDWVRYILDQPVRDQPGADFHYSGAAPHLLSAMLRRATGQGASAFAAQHLFRPLGIVEAKWLSDPQGNSIGESGLSLKPRDLAKIGLLYLRDGVWEGKRLLPPWWVPRLFGASKAHDIDQRRGLPPRYGLLWWVDAQVPMAVASGRHGQHLVILPRHDTILVLTAKTPDLGVQPLDISSLVTASLLPALRETGALPPNPDAQARLREFLRTVTAPSPLRGIGMPELALRVSGRSYRFESNPLGLASLSVRFSRDRQARLETHWRAKTAQGREGRLALSFGSDGSYLKGEATPFGTFASRGAWQDEATLLFQTEALENSVATQMRLHFRDDKLELTVTDGDGSNVSLEGRAR